MYNVPELDEDYITKTEDVLQTYEQPYNPKQLVVVVCLDEKPVTLHAEVRPASPAKPGPELIRTDASAHTGNTEPCRD